MQEIEKSDARRPEKRPGSANENPVVRLDLDKFSECRRSGGRASVGRKNAGEERQATKTVRERERERHRSDRKSAGVLETSAGETVGRSCFARRSSAKKSEVVPLAHEVAPRSHRTGETPGLGERAWRQSSDRASAKRVGKSRSLDFDLARTSVEKNGWLAAEGTTAEVGKSPTARAKDREFPPGRRPESAIRGRQERTR